MNPLYRILKQTIFYIIKQAIQVWKKGLLHFLCIVALLYLTTIQYNLPTKYLEASITTPFLCIVMLIEIVFHFVSIVKLDQAISESEDNKTINNEKSLKPITYLILTVPLLIPLIVEYYLWKSNTSFIPQFLITVIIVFAMDYITKKLWVEKEAA